VLNRFGEECRLVDLWGRLPTCRPVVNRPRGGKQPPRSLTSCPTGLFELIKSILNSCRPISEVIAELKARGSQAVIDDDFARDIEAGIEAHRQPWTPPSWE